MKYLAQLLALMFCFATDLTYAQQDHQHVERCGQSQILSRLLKNPKFKNRYDLTQSRLKNERIDYAKSKFETFE